MPVRLHTQDIDLYHATQFNIPLLWTGELLTTIHDCAYDRVPEEFGDRGTIARHYYKFMMTKAAEHSTSVVAVSEQTALDFREIYAAKNVHAIPLGVDKSLFQPDDTAAVLSQEYFLFVGSNRPRKNLKRLVEAYETFVSEVPNPPKFVFVGENDERFYDLTGDIASKGLEGHLLIFGQVDDTTLRSLYANALALVFPSLYEGFGLPVLEGMSAGTPVITSDRPPMSEVIGNAGLLVNPESSAAIADAMRQLSNDEGKRETLRTKGLERASQFEWSETAAQTALLYQRISTDGVSI
jgi:glycosyltransferase involved in cell wall biosynthesis